MSPEKRILDIEWLNLENGIRSAKHDYHSFILSTVRNNKPQLRTVILRDFNKTDLYLSFHTDLRSKKITDLKKNNTVGVLFYDRKRRVQLRISGVSKIVTDNHLIKSTWDKMSSDSKKCYLHQYPPSKVLNNGEINKVKDEQDTNLDNLGLERFCKIKIIIKKLDWLNLKHDGHKRIQYVFDKNIKINWIAS
ncbi:MAG: pyridoxamine 5'-phosphate oxidase family protein [Candidatus Neomarinimicrobiota bacterium]|mgnify:FL=1|tara:strand:- start:2661 stop:3236 length:576 start_codon:yes stop_codon:yes gene_type:complete